MLSYSKGETSSKRPGEAKRMMTNKIVFILLFSVYYVTVVFGDDAPCPFNSNCYCQFILSSVTCNHFEVFPTFAMFDDHTISSIQITGNFSYVPKHAFYQLKSLQNAFVQISRDELYQLPSLHVHPEAFYHDNPTAIDILEFEYTYFSSIPTQSLSGRSFYQVTIWAGVLNTVANFSFSNLTTSNLNLRLNNLATIDNGAFNGLNPDGRYMSYGIFSDNNLTEISAAFKTLKVYTLNFADNAISQVQDFAFSPCDVSGQCQRELSQISLTNNPITSISDNAFANVYNLNTLDIRNTQITEVPVEAMSHVASTVQWLYLTNNRIVAVNANSFYGFTSMINVVLDSNPIALIEPGAFNGATRMTVLQLNDLEQLTSVDLLITYGMTSVTQLVIASCPSLTTVNLTDATKLPTSLQLVDLSNSMNVNTISSQVQYWLSGSVNNTIDISYNYNIICDQTIAWMAKYAICQPIQIVTGGTTCSTTQQALSDYLAQFQPSCG